MVNKHKKSQKQPEQKATSQSTTLATPLELSEEELQQVTGGFNPQPEPPGKPAPSTSYDRDPGL